MPDLIKHDPPHPPPQGTTGRHSSGAHLPGFRVGLTTPHHALGHGDLDTKSDTATVWTANLSVLACTMRYGV